MCSPMTPSKLLPLQSKPEVCRLHLPDTVPPQVQGPFPEAHMGPQDLKIARRSCCILSLAIQLKLPEGSLVIFHPYEYSQLRLNSVLQEGERQMYLCPCRQLRIRENSTRPTHLCQHGPTGWCLSNLSTVWRHLYRSNCRGPFRVWCSDQRRKDQMVGHQLPLG